MPALNTSFLSFAGVLLEEDSSNGVLPDTPSVSSLATVDSQALWLHVQVGDSIGQYVAMIVICVDHWFPCFILRAISIVQTTFALQKLQFSHGLYLHCMDYVWIMN